MAKFSTYGALSAITSSTTVLVHKLGVIYQVTMATLFSDYYTRDEVDTKIAAVVAGGVPWQEYVFDGLSIAKNGTKEVTHNANNLNFRYEMLEWNATAGKYLKMQTPLAEADRTLTTVTFYSGRAISDFKLIVFG